MIDDKYPVLHAQVASQVMDGQAVVVLADTGRVNILNEVGTRIWELMDGTRTVRELAEVLASEFEVTREAALEDTRAFVQELVARNAVELRAEPV